MRRLRQAECPRSIFALILNVKIFRKRWNAQARPAKLPQLIKHNLSPSVVFLHRPMDLDHLVLQLADVSNALQIMRKNDDREWTHHGILAKVEKCNAPADMFYAQHFASDALVFADVLTSRGDWDAVAGK